MKVVCIGGGPASLYFSLLAKKTNPDWQINIYEQNPANVTWGFGVVFSDETMENFKDADFESYKAITDSFVHWDDIDVFRDTWLSHRAMVSPVCKGSSFFKSSRKEL